MLRKALLGSVFGLAASCAHAQTAPSPAQMGISTTTVPEVLQVLDNTKNWVTIGTVDPTTHTFTVVGGGGGGGGGQINVYPTHADLVTGAITAGHVPLMQEGFYAAGDGGAGTYHWNAASYCRGGTPSTPTAADGLTCILPAGLATTPGRYLLEMPNGILDTRLLGFTDDGSDNSSHIPALNAVRNFGGQPVVFSGNSVTGQSNYWFNSPLDIVTEGLISCGGGERAPNFPKVNLIFAPGVSGVRFFNINTAQSAGYTGLGLAGAPIGMNSANLNGCGIASMTFGGFTAGPAPIAGNPVVTTPSNWDVRYSVPAGSQRPMPVWAVGDAMVGFTLAPFWNFSGSVTGNVLTVTSTPAGLSSTDPGIAQGQMLIGGGVHGVYIAATHAENPTYTGTGGAGTYLLSASYASPPLPADAQPGTVTSGFYTVAPTNQPFIPPGTTIVSCTPSSGTDCPAGSSLTLSKAPTLGIPYSYSWMLPGPNSTQGSQMYNVTTSQTGNTYGPFTASISGVTMTVTSPSTGNTLNLGQKVIGVGGTPVTTTTTAALTKGQSVIPVASCTGIVNGMFVVGFSGGSPVFPPGTTVNNCTGTSLTINLQNSNPFSETTAGSNVIQLETYYTSLNTPWVGQPVTAANLPANTVVQSWKLEPYDSTTIAITLNNSASSTVVNHDPIWRTTETISFGGAIVAAPSSTSLTFLNGSDTITSLGTGTGGNGTYKFDSGYTLASTTLYAYDTPSTFYVTGGPRSFVPQDFIWSDAFPFGAVAARIYGASPTKETVVATFSDGIGEFAATASHTAGSGKMWVLPSGLMRLAQGNSYGNNIEGFGFAINLSCGGQNYPVTGCGRSKDEENIAQYNMVGRHVEGNNSGGSSSVFNEYDHNFVADIAELGTIGTSYMGEMLQGEDEGSNTHTFLSICGTNSSSNFGVYAAGAQWEAICLQTGAVTIGTEPPPSQQDSGAWFGPIWEIPWTPSHAAIGTPPLVSCPPGAPSSSFQVIAGVVVHC